MLIQGVVGAGQNLIDGVAGNIRIASDGSLLMTDPNSSKNKNIFTAVCENAAIPVNSTAAKTGLILWNNTQASNLEIYNVSFSSTTAGAYIFSLSYYYQGLVAPTSTANATVTNNYLGQATCQANAYSQATIGGTSITITPIAQFASAITGANLFNTFTFDYPIIVPKGYLVCLAASTAHTTVYASINWAETSI